MRPDMMPDELRHRVREEERVEPTTLPTDSKERKGVPLARGCLDYFPAALAEVARLSKAGNDKHNPGEELHHARGKSSDHADCIIRHLAERGTLDTDGFLHDVKVAWRALANLQEALEARGAPLARGARVEPSGPERTPDGHTRCRGCGGWYGAGTIHTCSGRGA